MARATTTTAELIPKGFSIRLRRLRARIAAWFLVDGLSRWLLCLVLVIGLDLLADWLFHMDRAQRTVVLILAAGILGAVLYRRVVRPLSCRLTDDALCLEIEDRNELLGQSLISAVQFARMGDLESCGVSPALVRATVDCGMRQAADVAFERVLRSGRFHANLALLVVTLLALTGVGVASAVNEPMAIWFDRNVLLGDRQWPQDVYLVVEGAENGRMRIPRGDDWPLVVTVRDDSRRLPDAVYIDSRGPDGQRSEPMERSDDRTFRTTWRNVVEGFDFRARARRASTPWITVELVDRPRVDELALAATPPQYAGGQTEPLPPGRGPYYLLKGSTLEVRGMANKPLSQAVLAGGGAPHEMTVSPVGGFHLALSADQVDAGVYRVELTDTERLMLPDASQPQPLRSERPASFTLKIKPDREPQVLAKLVGVGALVVPGARVPLECRVHDDYAVTAARLRYQWRGESDDSGQSAGKAGVAPLAEIDESPDRRAVSFQTALDLRPLGVPAGSQLRLFVEADDNDDVSGPKSGKSTTFVLRVVSEDELRTDLLRREKEHRLELEKCLKLQEDVATECQAMLASVRDRATLEADERKLLVALEKRQKLLGTNVADLAGRFESIIAEVRNNRLEEENGPLQRRLRDRVVDPMRTLTGDAIPQAARHLDHAWRLSSNAARRDAALAEAIVAQQSILAAIREILTHLVKVEGYQEAVNLLYEIQKAQKDVLDMTDAERQRRIREILNEGGGVSEKDKDK
jgi:hypothetical protein